MIEIIQVLLTAVIEPIPCFFGQALLCINAWLLFVPVCCVVFTPVVLVWAYFGPGIYGTKVAAGYKSICAGALWVGPPW